MKEKPKYGRPALPIEKRMTSRSVRMLVEQWEKFDLIGGAKWLRPTVEKAYAKMIKAKVKS